MGVGQKIKEFRSKAKLTQKDLADKLHVTYQAVSRWENDDTEPSIDTIKDICKILNCTIEDILEMPKNEIEPKVVVEEKVVYKEQKPVLAVCQRCNNPIYEPINLNRINEAYTVKEKHGRAHRNVTHYKEVILCNKCNKLRIEEEKKKEEEEKQKIREKFKHQRIHSFVWPAIVAIVLIAISISFFIKGDTTTGVVLLISGILSYLFLATMILNNTFIPDLWLDISSWSIKFPGIIFQLDFDGIKFFIILKIIFAILGFVVTACAFILATLVGMVLSVFVYPVALIKNINCVEVD